MQSLPLPPPPTPRADVPAISWQMPSVYGSQLGVTCKLIAMHQAGRIAVELLNMERKDFNHQDVSPRQLSAQDPKRSRLRELVPEVGNFYTNLGLVDALNEYDQFFALSRRRYVPPNFAEIRHVLNIAQVGVHDGQTDY